MKFIRCYDGSKYDFDNFDISYLISRYDRLCCNILVELEKGNFEYLEKLMKGGDYFGGLIYRNLLKVYIKFTDVMQERVVLLSTIKEIFLLAAL